MKIGASFLLLVATVAAVGCRESPRQMSAEERERRLTAHRVACAARYVAEEAQRNEVMLEATFANVPAADGQGPARPGQGVIEFARALSQHADTRGNIYIYLDSAVNHAATPADSARYTQRAGAFVTRPPLEGSIEANVAANYERNMAAVLQNEDHPCNWENLPF